METSKKGLDELLNTLSKMLINFQVLPFSVTVEKTVTRFLFSDFSSYQFDSKKFLFNKWYVSKNPGIERICAGFHWYYNLL